MLDTVRFCITDMAFYQAVCAYRQNDLGGTIPARINADSLRQMVIEGKVINFEEYKERKIQELLADLNEHGLQIVIKDFFQLRDMGSWCRDISCIIDEWNHKIHIEVSLPKFVNGQNVDLLFDYRTSLIDFVNYLYQFFRVSPPNSDSLRSIELTRADFCYYYRYQSQIHALDFIRSFKSWCKHKRKKVAFYDTSVMFVGASYSLKFYMKYDEFQAHDKKEIVKKIGSLMDFMDQEDRSGDVKRDLAKYTDLINYCDLFSTGMVRCEFTIRKKKLNYDGVFTLGHLFDLDVVSYYEGLLDKMGVLKMGHSGKDEVFNKLKNDKKLIQYAAMLEIYGKDKIKEMYERTTIYRYDKMLKEMNICIGDFDILRDVDLSVRSDDIARINATADNYQTALRFANGELF